MEPALDDDPSVFACPRCREETAARFYGPCPACRAQLIASQAGSARVIDAGRYEPAMNVVPNQVATKE